LYPFCTSSRVGSSEAKTCPLVDEDPKTSSKVPAKEDAVAAGAGEEEEDDASFTRNSHPRTCTQLLWLCSARVRGRTRQTLRVACWTT
jgi:hypothetical protein